MGGEEGGILDVGLLILDYQIGDPTSSRMRGTSKGARNGRVGMWGGGPTSPIGSPSREELGPLRPTPAHWSPYTSPRPLRDPLRVG